MITFKDVNNFVQGLWYGDDSYNWVGEVMEWRGDDGFNAVILDGGWITFYKVRSSDGEAGLDMIRGFERPLTDEELHILCFEGGPNAPEFDPNNPIVTWRKWWK